jgi:TPR repeat protein
MQRSAKFHEAMAAYENDRADLARRLMAEAAEEGDSVACFMLARWCRGGVGGPVDTKTSAAWMVRLEEMADGGDIDAQWVLGQSCRLGDLFPRSIERANYWLERAADAGHAEAQYRLASYMETAQYNYPEDPDEAALWYERAFAQDHPQALYRFALKKFRNGQPTEEAIALLRKAADKGFKPAEDVLHSYRH